MPEETIRLGHSVVTVHSRGFIALSEDQQAQWLARQLEAGDGAAQAIVDAALAVLLETRRNNIDSTHDAR